MMFPQPEQNLWVGTVCVIVVSVSTFSLQNEAGPSSHCGPSDRQKKDSGNDKVRDGDFLCFANASLWGDSCDA